MPSIPSAAPIAAPIFQIQVSQNTPTETGKK